MSDTAARPNIRIEIHNNLAEESMEVDEAAKASENEDGEISDNEADDVMEEIIQSEPVTKSISSSRLWSNKGGSFSTGINVFDKEEQEKLKERAKRFQLELTETASFNDNTLQELHDSLGVPLEDERNIRFETIHMRGADGMSANDLQEYFRKYRPVGIEWITDDICNVVFEDNISTARALFYLSSAVKGMPSEGSDELELNESNNKNDDFAEKGKSILLRNSNREVELSDDTPSGEVNKTFHISDIKVPIPSGYWRLGVKTSKSKCILMRYSFNTDKKPQRAEKFSEYYRKMANPTVGLISQSRMKIKGIFDRHHVSSQSDDSTKNPWGTLAENWHEDARYTERIVMPHKPKPTNANDTSGIMNRLGFKRAHEEEKEEAKEEEEEEPKSKSKVPRMRMYADEEEEKIKRKRKLQAVKLQANMKKEDEPAKSDLRNILKPVVKVDAVIDIEENAYDLGSKLKNRNRRWQQAPEITTFTAKPLEISIDNTEYMRNNERRHKEISYHRNDRSNRSTGGLHSDRLGRKKHRPARDAYYEEEEEELDRHKPRSKVAVVIKTAKKPTVASQVQCSRLHSDREERYKSQSVKSRVRQASTSSEESSSSSSSSSSSEESSSEDEQVDKPRSKGGLRRPGFVSDAQKKLDHKSPLRIEISNDHFKKE